MTCSWQRTPTSWRPTRPEADAHPTRLDDKTAGDLSSRVAGARLDLEGIVAKRLLGS